MLTLGEFIRTTIAIFVFMCGVVFIMFLFLSLFAFIYYLVERKRNGINRDAY